MLSNIKKMLHFKVSTLNSDWYASLIFLVGGLVMFTEVGSGPGSIYFAKVASAFFGHFCLYSSVLGSDLDPYFLVRSGSIFFIEVRSGSIIFAKSDLDPYFL